MTLEEAVEILMTAREMYPGNESEQPVFRNIINGLKKRNNIKEEQ